jgi:hypothetical protein
MVSLLSFVLIVSGSLVWLDERMKMPRLYCRKAEAIGILEVFLQGYTETETIFPKRLWFIFGIWVFSWDHAPNDPK